MRECMLQTAECWLSQATLIIETIVNDYFADSLCCYTRADIQTAIADGQLLHKLKRDVTEHLSVLANINKVVFFQLIKQYAVENNVNLATLPLSELGLSQVQHDFNQIAETIKMTCEEIQEIINSTNLNTSSSDNLTTILENIFHEEFKVLANSICIDPTIKLVSAFLASCRQQPQLATMAAFNKEDAALKKAISDLNFITNRKKNAEFLLEQLRATVNDVLRSNPNDKILLKFAIKFGFALPMDAIKSISDVVQSIFAKNGYSTGFKVLVFAEDSNYNTDKPVLEFATEKTAKLVVKLQCFDNQFFLCRADSVKNSKEMNTNESCFYENLMNVMKHLRKCFPDHQASFREELIKCL